MIAEEGSAEALTLRKRHRLMAPDLLIAEFANVLRTKIRAGDIDEARAEIAAQAIIAAGIDLRPMKDLLLPALDIAIRLQHPAYDCFYLALAAIEDCLLVTEDQRFLQAVTRHGSPKQRAACISLDDAIRR
ncbi:type II toxin-antitoxin system VapC family toxin [Bosea sp. PAMC 26642]|uniref:type II toxin-antitoxin system VapC family toxin n=1 Tax=Bosea sp. (strain PAMC 26642) TaxID=1792307 RepID=UPI00143B8A43|nr:type II toxin-antitoxin system VapC family toxin [Bosea sp. PAMC 26642]